MSKMLKNHGSNHIFFTGKQITGDPPLTQFHHYRSHYRNCWLMYVQAGDFCFSRGPLTVPHTHISWNLHLFQIRKSTRKVDRTRLELSPPIGSWVLSKFSRRWTSSLLHKVGFLEQAIVYCSVYFKK